MPNVASTQNQSPIHTSIVALWQRNQPQILDRLAVLDRAAAALSPAHRAEAIATAHKLAGTLGMFGFHEGTRIARELELHLESPSPDLDVIKALSDSLRHSLFPAV
jgi:HPt (histidine-containing phosphotransfer) domain-containing protein